MNVIRLRHQTLGLAAAGLILGAPMAAAQMSHDGGAGSAKLFENMGSLHRAITTRSEMAQKYFDQGLTWMYAYNLDEAKRAFEEAARLDPDCASCWWGVGLALGPHFNLPALPDRTVAANQAAQKAYSIRSKGSPVEQALIDALVLRYSDPAPQDPGIQRGLDSTYAAAMRVVWKKFPDDDDVGVLMCEGLMDLYPWDLYDNAGKPRSVTPEVVSTLEKILKRNPNHVGANHLYIHAVEPVDPKKALASAERLGSMVPSAGHLVHMPSHIYGRVGEYVKATESNRKAVDSDDAYAKAAGPQGYYRMYMAHNHHFLSWSAMMEGRRTDAVRHAREVVKTIPLQMLKDMPGMDSFWAEPGFVMVRFGMWDEIINSPPLADIPFLNGCRHYGRGLAHAAKGNLGAASRERDSLAAVLKDTPPEAMQNVNSTRVLLGIALDALDADLAARGGAVDRAITHYKAAIAAEDGLRYTEPPDWIYPIRHWYGAMLLSAKRPKDAEAVYREDLKRWPENGWSLRGLAEALKAQGKTNESTTTMERAMKAWARADVEVAGSRQ